MGTTTAVATATAMLEVTAVDSKNIQTMRQQCTLLLSLFSEINSEMPRRQSSNRFHRLGVAVFNLLNLLPYNSSRGCSANFPYAQPSSALYSCTAWPQLRRVWRTEEVVNMCCGMSSWTLTAATINFSCSLCVLVFASLFRFCF